MARAKTLHTCSLKDRGGSLHPCGRADAALRDAGHRHEAKVFDRNRPFGLFTKGKRPDLKRMTGQEQLPVLELDDGDFVVGSGAIVRWARANTAA